MKPAANLQNNSLRFLLYLEWVLLGIVGLSELSPIRISLLPRHPLLNLLCLGIFAVMGLRLPNRVRSQVAYTGLEALLIFVMIAMGRIRLFPFLYLILITRNDQMFVGWRRFFVSAIALLMFALTLLHRLQYPVVSNAVLERIGFVWFSMTLLFSLMVLFLQLAVNAVQAERKNREQLAATNNRLRQYALKIEELAMLQERNRIAREIHDSLGHSLTAFNLHLEAALRLLHTEPEEAQDLLVEAKQLSSNSLNAVRQSVATLRSDPLQGRSLEQAIASLTEDLQRSTGINPVCQIQIAHPLNDSIKTVIYRIVQEALTNICKYATATEVWISINTMPNLQVIIQDNGKGFDLNQNTTGFGLQGMQERATALNGNLEICTAPGQGCTITATFPAPMSGDLQS